MRHLKIGIALLLLATLLYFANLADLAAALSALTPALAAYLMLISVLLVYISALKWSLFLGVVAQPVSVIRLFCLYLLGYFVNLILPSYIGGDVTRSYYIGKQVGQHGALAATVLERYTGIVAMVGLALVTMWFAPLVTFGVQCAVLSVALALVLGTALVLHPGGMRLLQQLAVRFGRRAQKIVAHAERVREALTIAAGKPRLLAGTLALSLLFHSVTVVNTIACGYSVGWTTAPPLSLFVVLPLALLVAALPLTPSGYGVQEGAFFVALTSLGATPAQALGVALILRAKSYILAFCGFFVWLAWRPQKHAQG